MSISFFAFLSMTWLRHQCFALRYAHTVARAKKKQNNTKITSLLFFFSRARESCTTRAVLYLLARMIQYNDKRTKPRRFSPGMADKIQTYTLTKHLLYSAGASAKRKRGVYHKCHHPSTNIYTHIQYEQAETCHATTSWTCSMRTPSLTQHTVLRYHYQVQYLQLATVKKKKTNAFCNSTIYYIVQYIIA